MGNQSPRKTVTFGLGNGAQAPWEARPPRSQRVSTSTPILRS